MGRLTCLFGGLHEGPADLYQSVYFVGKPFTKEICQTMHLFPYKFLQFFSMEKLSNPSHSVLSLTYSIPHQK